MVQAHVCPLPGPSRVVSRQCSASCWGGSGIYWDLLGFAGIYWDLLPVDAKPQPPPQTWEETESISPRSPSQPSMLLLGCPRAGQPSGSWQDTHGRGGGQWGPSPAGGAGQQQPAGSRPGDCRDLGTGGDSAPGTTLPQQLWGMEGGLGKGEKQGRSSEEQCRM